MHFILTIVPPPKPSRHAALQDANDGNKTSSVFIVLTSLQVKCICLLKGTFHLAEWQHKLQKDSLSVVESNQQNKNEKCSPAH